jgi:hypothetical protein
MLGLLLLAATSALPTPSAPPPPSPWVFALDGSVGAQITSTGVSVASVATGPDGGGARANYTLGGAADGGRLQTTLLPSSPLGPSTCTPSGGGAVVAAANGSISLAQLWACTAPHPASNAMVDLVVTVMDVFSPADEAIDITTTINVDRADVPFTAGLGLALAPAGATQFWTPWAKGCVQNNGRSHGMCFAPNKPWSEPFSAAPLSTATVASYRYGGGGTNDTFSLPIVSLLDATKDAALSLALSPEDTQLELNLQVQNGGASFVRDLHRLGQGREVVLHSHLLGHAACFRPGLGFLTRRFADYFEPWVEDAADYEGTASYSWYQGPYNVTRAKSLGFKTNW